MKTIKLILLLLVLPVLGYGQIIGFGGQYSQDADGQFVFNMAYPTYIRSNPLNIFMLSGLEYTTPGGSKLSGIHIKPVQLATYFSDYLFYQAPVTCTLGIDAGFLADFRGSHKSTVVLSPNFYLDYKLFFLKTGYDMDVLHGKQQYYVRAGVGFTLGTVKNITIK